jgi:hypothetical protein
MRAEFEIIYCEEPVTQSTKQEAERCLQALEKDQRQFKSKLDYISDKKAYLIETTDKFNASLNGKAKIVISFIENHPVGEDWIGVNGPQPLTVRELISQLEKLDPDLRVFDRSDVDGCGGLCLRVSEVLVESKRGDGGFMDFYFYTEKQVLTTLAESFPNGTDRLERAALIESDRYDFVDEWDQLN